MSDGLREAVCWHCHDVILVPARVHCERCSDECDNEDCAEPGCAPEPPAPTEGEPENIVEQFDAAREELQAQGVRIRASDWLDPPADTLCPTCREPKSVGSICSNAFHLPAPTEEKASGIDLGLVADQVANVLRREFEAAAASTPFGSSLSLKLDRYICEILEDISERARTHERTLHEQRVRELEAALARIAKSLGLPDNARLVVDVPDAAEWVGNLKRAQDLLYSHGATRGSLEVRAKTALEMYNDGISEHIELEEKLEATTAELEEARRSLEFTRQWYAERCERLWHWAHKDKEHRGEYFAIMANGSTAHEPPTYAQILNLAKHRAAIAERERDEAQAKVRELSIRNDLGWDTVEKERGRAETAERELADERRKASFDVLRVWLAYRCITMGLESAMGLYLGTKAADRISGITSTLRSSGYVNLAVEESASSPGGFRVVPRDDATGETRAAFPIEADSWGATVAEWRRRANEKDTRLAELERQLAAWRPLVEAQATPWPLVSVLEKLTGAADRLLRDHDYDGHGWELIGAARDAGRQLLDALRAAESEPTDRG